MARGPGDEKTLLVSSKYHYKYKICHVVFVPLSILLDWNEELMAKRSNTNWTDSAWTFFGIYFVSTMCRIWLSNDNFSVRTLGYCRSMRHSLAKLTWLLSQYSNILTLKWAALNPHSDTLISGPSKYEFFRFRGTISCGSGIEIKQLNRQGFETGCQKQEEWVTSEVRL